MGALVKVGNAVTTGAAQSVVPAVQRRLQDITINFHAGAARSESDRVRSMQLYAKAVAHVHPYVAAYVLDWMQLPNPRNPFAPTAQDLFEESNATDRCFRLLTNDFYFDGKWAEPPTSAFLKPNNEATLARYADAKRGGKPGEPDCIIPEDLAIEYLREEIEKHLPHIENPDERNRGGYGEPLLLAIKDEVLDRIPEAAFPEGVLEMIRAKRAARMEAARKAAEHEAYIAGLPDEVRAMRWIVVRSEAWQGKDETEIIAETNRRLAIVRTDRANAEAEGGKFTGCAFGDGTEWRERDFEAIYGRRPRSACQ